MNTMIRTTSKNDLDKFKTLWESAFLQNIELSYLEWKYNNFEYGVIYEEGDIFVAFYGGVKLNCVLGDNIIDVIQINDSCSHPDYRYKTGDSPFKKTVDYFFSIYDTEKYLHYGFPGLRHHKLGKLILDYQDFDSQLKIYEIESNFEKKLEVIEIEDVNELQCFKSDLLEINKNCQKFALLRDYDFIKWRFFDKPNNSYKFSAYIKDNILLGYICYEVKKDFIYIIDILYNRQIDILLSLLGHLPREKNIKFYLSDSGISKQLVSIGFIEKELDIDIKIVHRTECKNIDSDFYQTLADTDIF